MLWIADSGSTSTSWCCLNDGQVVKMFQTGGMNPFFRTSDEMAEELHACGEFAAAAEAEQVFFYGAGIVDAARAEEVKAVLRSVFSKAVVEISGDVLGAARALLGRQAGVACILGTGSNAAIYSGSEVTGGIPPMGYILGDEGSGAVLGRQLLSDYFKLAMPEDLRKKFAMQFKLTREEVLERVYRGNRPNFYLAGYAVFLSEHIDHAWCCQVVREAFSAFFHRNVIPVASPDTALGFVGSVAVAFSPILHEVAQTFGYPVVAILKDPMEGLIRFHSSQ